MQSSVGEKISEGVELLDTELTCWNYGVFISGKRWSNSEYANGDWIIKYL